MSSLLIDGGCVLTMDADRLRIDDGFLLIEDGAIARLGRREELPEGLVADERIDARGSVVVPGLVNGHHHHWCGLFRGLGGGMLLERWITDLLVPAGRAMRVEDAGAASRLACMEMIAGGTTTCLNHCVTETDGAWAEATLRPVVESGMRQLYAKELRPQALDEALAEAAEIHRHWDGAGDGRIGVGLVIETTAHWVALGACSEELVMRGAELARDLGARISDHVAGGTMSREAGYLRFMLETGRSDVEYLHGLGVLDSRWVLAHALNLRDRDVELIGTGGAHLIHTPTSEGSRGAGIAPLRRLRAAGAGLGLGTDGPMVDASVDMVEQMKAAVLLQNQLHLDPLALSAEDALAMATIDAAKALGLADRIGSLEVGKRADVAIFDLERLGAAPWHDPAAALVHSGRGADARWVLVEGEPLVSEGELVRYDRSAVAEVIDEARARAQALLRRAEVPAHRSLSRRAQPSPPLA